MKGFCLEVTGEYACFTRPEMKVERVSYDVITPSAARAVFEAILWKPAIRWRVTAIDVLEPIRWASVRRNEVSKTASPRSAGIFIEDDRQQRAGLFLRDVRYRLHAQFDFIPPEARAKTINPVPEWLIDAEEAAPPSNDRPAGTPGATPEARADESEAKYAAMFQRRARKGQCFNQPYLGCREFSAGFRLIEEGDLDAAPPPPPPELAGDHELGWMLYDLDFSNPAAIRPLFYKPVMRDGRIAVPPRESEEVRG